MAQEIINVGALPNDGTGDPLRVAYQKINENFDQLFSAASQYVSKIIAGSGVSISPTSGFGDVTINMLQVLEIDGEDASVVNPDQLIVDGGEA